MKFSRLAQYWQEIEKTSSRLEMTAILARLFKEAQANEIDKLVYLSLGRLRPKYEGIEFSLAEKMMVKVISRAYRCPAGEIFKKTGDLGETVTRCRPAPRREQSRQLAVSQLYQMLYEIAVDSGLGSQERKIQSMADLLSQLDSLSAKYLVRIPVNKLRLGFSEMTVLDALSWMEKGDKSRRPELEKAFNVCADIGFIAQEYKNNGIERIRKIVPQIGVPIRPQKSERLPSAEKIVEKLGRFAVEGKWDGLRVQIHLDKNKRIKDKANSLFGQENFLVKIFSRNLDNMTSSFPDIAAAARKLPADNVILDGEAVGFDPQTGRLLAFQETVQRKRKHGVGEMAKTVPLKVFVYDLLFLNGKSRLEQPFSRRRQELETIMSGVKSGLELADQAVVSAAASLRELREKYLALGLEGVMCKKLSEPYRAGARNFNWVKFKKVTQGELADTIDAVVMGYYLGKGKRAGLGIGAFLVGVTDGNRIGSVAKIGTGLSDEQWRELKVRCARYGVRRKPENYLVNKNLTPDGWVKPAMVVEIMADEITKSPIHAFSLALRFPRLVRFRDDKQPEEATSKKEIKQLYNP